jgi:regulator of sirC expression with transglutaminase-like and TPR domain
MGNRMEPPDPRLTSRTTDPTSAEFAELMRRRDEDVPLDRAAALLARGVAYPELNPDEVAAQLDDLAAGLMGQLPLGRDPRQIAEALRRFLGDEIGFRGPDSGREADYYDARNSFINDVLGRRIGIPIALSVIYLEVARRIDFPLVGVGLPGHFLIKHPLGDAPEDGLFLDPFQRGAVLSLGQIRTMFDAHFGGRARFETHYLGAVTKKQLLTRALQNLKNVYYSRNQLRTMLTVFDYLLLIAPWDLDSRRDRGMLALRLGETALALADLQAYEAHATGDSNLPLIRGYIEALRRRFALGG